MFCNLLSCWSLYRYMRKDIGPAVELQYEIAFLLIKGVVEMFTAKFSWSLLLHHSAMVLGFVFAQHPSITCFAWVVVHQQLVHFPFALRAAWRLTLPALGYIQNELSWRRRFISNFFWMSWMFVIGYRNVLLWARCRNYPCRVDLHD